MSDDIDRKAVSQRNKYIRERKTSQKVPQKAPQNVPQKAPQNVPQNVPQKVSQKISQKGTQKASQNSRIIDKRRSLIGKSRTATNSSTARSKILGKNKESAVRKNSKKKSLAKYAGSVGKNAAGLVADTARQAKAQIKNIAVQNKVQELANSKEPADMLVMLGEKGITGAVKMSGIVINFIFKVIVNVLKAIASCLGSYFFIVIAALALIFVVYMAGEVQYVHNVTAYTYSEDSDTTGMVEGSVKVPRLAGTDTELTYKEVTHNKWYSAHVAEGGTPFSGDIGLDRYRGDWGGNCTAYAWGRRCELEGERTKLGAAGDAYIWYAREIAAGIYKCGQKAEVGAVCCWSYGYEGDGHVAVIEEINTDGSIITSNSGYSTRTLFYNNVYSSEEELKAGYGIFQGYIYLEKK